MEKTEKPPLKKPIFSTKDLPSSSNKLSDVPIKLKKKLKGKSQKTKKPYKKSESITNTSSISKVPQKTIEVSNDPLDPSLQLILPFFLLKESYELNYISNMSYFLNCSGITEENYDQIMSKREKFQNYPFYLKHTIFQEDEQIHKTRNSSFELKLQGAHENLMKGNVSFQNEKYSDALVFYERALGGFTWLEMIEPDQNNPEYIEYKKSINRVVGHLKKQKESGMEVDNIYGNLEIEKNHKFLFSPITDENSIMHNDIIIKLDITQKKQLDNCLFAIYLNIAACYLKENNFYESLTALEDAIKLHDKNAILYFRRSQALAYNKDSHLEDLYQAKIDLFQSREIMLYETKGKNQLKNASDEKILIEYYKYLEERISERKKYEKIVITSLVQQAKDTKTNNFKDKKPMKPEEIPEYEQILDMVGRYVRILEIYKEYKEQDKTKEYLKGYLEVKTVLSEMEFYLSIDFDDIDENDVLLELTKELKVNFKDTNILNALNILKMIKAQEIFKKADLKTDLLKNFSVDGLKNVQGEDEEDEKLATKPKNKVKWDLKDLLTWDCIIRVILLLVIIWIFYYINRNNAMFNRIFFNSYINA